MFEKLSVTKGVFMKYLFILMLFVCLVGCGGSEDDAVGSDKCEALEQYNLVMLKMLSCTVLSHVSRCNIKTELQTLYENLPKLQIATEAMDEVIEKGKRETKKFTERVKIEKVCDLSDSELECAYKGWSFVYKNLKRLYSCK